MKIVCQNCSATYKIADDKVQGKKVFKLKCKKCSADILVRGTEHEVPAPQVQDATSVQETRDENEATRAMDTSGYASGQDPAGVEGIWHAVINGDNQGPFTVEQLRGFLADGNIDAGTYVWREGFDGWQPMNEVGELGMLLSNGVAQAPASADIFSVPSMAPSAAAFSGSFSEPLAAPGAVESGGMFAPVEQRVARSSADSTSKARASTKGGDLFAAEVRAEEAMRPATQESRPSSEAATGQRNENSVLFSLATLQQLSGAESSAASGTPASSDSSGLIDINKLAGAINKGGSKKSSIDDIMSVGSSSGLNSPLAAPVLMPMALPPAPAPLALVEMPRPQGTNKTVIITGAIVATILSATAIAMVVVLKNGNNGDGVTTAAANISTNNTAPSPSPSPSPLPAPVVAPTPPPVLAVAPTVPESNTPTAPHPSGGVERPRARPTHVAHASSPAASPSLAHPTAAGVPLPGGPSTPSSRPAAHPSSGSIEDLLNRIPGGSAPTGPASRPSTPTAPTAPTTPTAPSGGGELPVTPSQPSVLSAMRGLGPSVRTCGNGAGGRVIVTITFASSGRVTTANASGEHAGDAIGSCAAQRVRSATVPPFRNPTFNVTYPFTLQ